MLTSLIPVKEQKWFEAWKFIKIKNNTLLLVFLGYLYWYAAALSPSYSLSCVPPSLHQIHPIQIFSFNIVSNLLHTPPPMQFFMSSLFLTDLSSYSPPLTPFCASVTFCFLRHLDDSVHLQYGGLLGIIIMISSSI